MLDEDCFKLFVKLIDGWTAFGDGIVDELKLLDEVSDIVEKPELVDWELGIVEEAVAEFPTGFILLNVSTVFVIILSEIPLTIPITLSGAFLIDVWIVWTDVIIGLKIESTYLKKNKKLFFLKL